MSEVDIDDSKLQIDDSKLQIGDSKCATVAYKCDIAVTQRHPAGLAHRCFDSSLQLVTDVRFRVAGDHAFGHPERVI